MKDQVFSGRDVAEAVASAARALGLPAQALRYVVLERGSSGSLGMAGTSARIAVLLDAHAHARPTPMPTGSAGSDPREPRAGIERVLGSVAVAAGAELELAFEDAADALGVRLSGSGCELLVEEDGRVFEALEHLLQRMFARALHPRRLTLVCPAYREQREATLRAMARELAAAVREDGRPRRTRPLNSYERRIVHLVVGEEAGVRTYSVGEGAERRVTVAPAEDVASGEGRG